MRSIVTALILITGVAPDLLAQEKDELRRCDKPIGILAVNEPQQEYMRVFQRYSLGSPAALLRMMAQQSKCFLVVERGMGMQNIKQERELAAAGEMQADANMGKGQMKAADFVLTAQIQVVDNNAGGAGGVVGGVLGRRAPIVGALGGGVAAAEGKARKTNWSLGAIGWAGAVVGVGAYSNTAEGKVIAASYMDNFNNIVDQMKADAGLMARADKFSAEGLSGADTKSGMTYAEGDVLSPKIDNVKIFASPADGATAAATLKKTDELVFLGEEKDGYLKVQGSSAEGWIKKTLVSKKQ
jgi:hypothetical protein